MFLKNIKANFDTSRFLFKHGKLTVPFLILLNILMGFAPFLLIIITQNLITEIEKLVTNSGQQSYGTIFFWLSLEIICIVFTSLADVLKNYVYSKFQIKISFILNKEILNKVNKISYINYEIPSFHNHLNRVTNTDPGSRVLSPFMNMLDLLKLGITLYSMVGYLFTIHWSLLAIAFLSAGPTLLVSLKFGIKFFSLTLDQTAPQREANYITSLFSDKQSSKEIRLFNLGDYLISKWSTLFLRTSKERLKMTTKFEGMQAVVQGVTLISYGLSVVVMIYLISESKMGIGVFIAVIQALKNTQSSLNQIASLIGRIFEDNLYLDDIYKFLNMVDEYEPVDNDNALFKKTSSEIEIINASFKYPQSEKYTLKDINLKIKTGQKIAIVGANGSGKSTLIKCLTGLYPLTQGDIYFNGTSIKKVNAQDLFSRISIIFQDFIRYNLTVRENIGFGNIKEIQNNEKLHHVVKKTNIDKLINSYKNKFDTKLGRQLYNGEDLSGGQWQRIAISRALFSEADILVFDEPTSSLDPHTEVDIVNKIYKNTMNKTVLFISHRMAATTIADKIIVMKDGEVCESGTHLELMKMEGEYYNMYRAQQNWFIEDSKSSERLSI